MTIAPRDAFLAVDARDRQRSSMFLAAVLRSGSEQAPVKVRNMSPTGAMIETPLAPAIGSKVELLRGSLVVQGTVVWRSAARCGVHFASHVSVKDWLAPPSMNQQRVDDMIALVKAGPCHLARSPGPPPEPRSDSQMVDDLGAVERLMQDLEDDLSASSQTLERHALKLQNLDIAMQMVRAIAGELARGGTGAPATGANLKDLRLACAKALGVD